MNGSESGDVRCFDSEMAGFRGGRRGSGGRGRGGRHGGRAMRVGRTLGQDGLKLMALALVAERPRHGYDIIKVIEEATGGSYAPSSSLVYPTLTLLEELGHLSSQPEGSKKLYVITEQGRTHLEDNRAIADTAFKRLAAFGQQASRMRQDCRDADCGLFESANLSSFVRAALDNLRDMAGKRLSQDPDVEAEVVAIVARAAGDLRKASPAR